MRWGLRKGEHMEIETEKKMAEVEEREQRQRITHLTSSIW